MRYTVMPIALLLTVFTCSALYFFSGPPSVPAEVGQTGQADFVAVSPDHVRMSGSDNMYRVVVMPDGEPAIELAAGNQGRIEFFQEVTAGPDVMYQFRLQFLSTQGTGQVRLTAVGSDGLEIGRVGWAVTGKDLPATDRRQRWFDRRLWTNYQGDWLSQESYVNDSFKQQLPELDLSAAEAFRLSVVVGEGQHAYITKSHFSREKTKAVRLRLAKPAYRVVLGDEFVVEAELENVGHLPLESMQLDIVEPYGYGLLVRGANMARTQSLQPGERQRLAWTLKAQRPDAVNFSRPWTVKFRADGEVIASLPVAVADPRPGKVFYVMTEDLEPIDSAGYSTAWGNQNGWLDPEEFMVQMVHKAEKLNEIATKHGAKWTHYIAWPAIRAAEWTAGKSELPYWRSVVRAVEKSVGQQTRLGHEYALHLHSDYDPQLKGTILSYNPEVDGFWANHLRHGWAHSVYAEGDYTTYNSRTGMLYAYQKVLDELAQDSGQGQILTARVGSFDFGNGDIDELMSTRAYRKVGLWGSSDADGNTGGVTSGSFDQSVYLAKPEDINTAADDLTWTGLVEFRPDMIMYDNQPAAVMNRKADQGMGYFTQDGKVRPGVHAITGFTHAMFIMGEGDWHSLEGKQFTEIDNHLRYLKEKYADQGLLQFATATEMVREYLDYYTPTLLAVYGPITARREGVTEYRIDILGRDLPVDAEHKHQVSLTCPLYLRETAAIVEILRDGQVITTLREMPREHNDVVFTVDDRKAAYTLRVRHNPQRGQRSG